MGKYSLSKTSFIKGLQCLKYLYLYKNHYKLRDYFSPQKLATFKRGHQVGFLAQDLFPNGVNLQVASHFQYAKAIDNTQKHIHTGTQYIYEAAFTSEDILVFLDILEKKQDGYYAYEVKSSLSVSETYLNDAALQYFVITNAGLKLKDFFIVYVNEHYVKKGQLNKTELFRIESVRDVLIEKQDFIIQNIRQQKETLKNTQIPDIEVGTHCFLPYKCDFHGYCWANIKKQNSLLHLEFLPIAQVFDFINKNISSPQQLLEADFVTDTIKEQIQSYIQKKDFINLTQKETLLKPISNECVFLNILSFKPAIPIFENNKPFDFLPYQLAFSYDDLSQNKLFIKTKRHNDFDLLLAFLNSCILENKTIIVYNKEATINLLKIFLTDYQYISFFDKLNIFGLDDFFTTGAFVSYKLNTTNDATDVLIDLKLKRPYFKKGSINNDFDAHDMYVDYLSSFNEINKEMLKEYGIEKNKDLTKLFDFLKSK